MTPASAGQTTLLDAVSDVRARVADITFAFPPNAARRAEARRRALITQLDDAVLPRLRELSAPAIVVFGGSTGAGKSTIVNSLLGREVAQTGVLRPTTRQPVLVVNPLDVELLAGHPVLDLVDLVRSDGTPRGIALLDAPDVDSVSQANRDLARRLLGVADLWLFVTTSARYGDAVPWDLLDQVRRRKVPIAVVLNRVPDAALSEVRRDLLARLAEHGMKQTPMFTLPELGPHAGVMSATLVADLRDWLDLIAGPDQARGAVLRSLRGTLDAVMTDLEHVAGDAEAEQLAVRELRELTQRSAGHIATRAAEHADDPLAPDDDLPAAFARLGAHGGPLETIITRRGRVTTSRRKRRARAEALQPIVRLATDAATEKLLRAGDACEAAIRQLLDSAEGTESGEFGAGTVEQQHQRREIATRRVAGWREQVSVLLRGSDNEEVLRLHRAVGIEGSAAITMAAAAGCDEAADLMRRIAPTYGADLVADAAQRLHAEAKSMAEDRLRYLERWMDDLAVPDTAVVALRRQTLKLSGMLL